MLLYFDRVSERSPCAVGFQRRAPHILRQNLSCDIMDKAPLRRPVWRCQARARTVLLHARAKDPRTSQGPPTPQYKRPAAFPATVPIRSGIECVTPAMGRRHTSQRDLQGNTLTQELSANSHSPLALSSSQRARAHVHRRQRRRACRVNAVARTNETENKRKPTRRNRSGGAARCEDGSRFLSHETTRFYPDKHAHLRTAPGVSPPLRISCFVCACDLASECRVRIVQHEHLLRIQGSNLEH